MVSVVPLVKKSSMYQGKTDYLKLPEDYDQFLNSFPKGTVLIAFGNTWQPREKRFVELISMIRQLPDVGFIISLKLEWASHHAIKNENFPNVYLRTFVPQKELLNDKRVFTFISHGGANSIQESLYYGKPIIGMPLAWDQYGTCYRMETLGAGISLADKPLAKNMVKIVRDLIIEPGKPLHEIHRKVQEI